MQVRKTRSACVTRKELEKAKVEKEHWGDGGGGTPRNSLEELVSESTNTRLKEEEERGDTTRKVWC